MRNIILFVTVLVFVFAKLLADTNVTIEGRDFLIRNPAETRNIKGGLRVIGNTVLCVYDNNGVCKNDTGNLTNDDLNLKYIDVDGVNRTYNNSSKAKLEIPSGAKIKWAGLYTQGYINDPDEEDVKNIVKGPVYLTLPNIGTVASVPLVVDLYVNSNDGYTYGTYAPVNELIGKTGSEVNGWITGANIKADTGKENSGLGNFGAWTLVIIYEDLNESLKNISVFDGYKRVSAQNPSVNITVSGFLTPTSGPIYSTVSIFVGEGDKNIKGDGFYVDSTAINETNAFYSTTSGFDANPSITNNQGIDIQNHSIGIDGNMSHPQIIGNNQQSSTITLTSNQDAYFPSMIAFATELYEPDVCYNQTILDANGNPISGPIPIGSDIMLDIMVTNENYEPAKGVTVETFLDKHLNYFTPSTKESIAIQNIGDANYSSRTDQSGDDIAEAFSENNASVIRYRIGTGATASSGGQVDYQKKAYTKFKAKLESDPGGSIDNKFLVSYTNEILGMTFARIPMRPCREQNNSLPAYQPALGSFDVVHHGGVSDGVDDNSPVGENHLYTQIAGQQFPIDIIALKEDFKTIKTDYKGLLVVQLVDLEIPGNVCEVNSSTVFHPSVLKTDYYGMDPQDNGRKSVADYLYNNARRNLAYRVMYAKDPYDQYVQWTCVNNTFNCVWGMLQKTYSKPVPCEDVCKPGSGTGNNQASPECLECVFGDHGGSVCSRDNFSIRPKNYVMDMNETTLRAGRLYKLDINATRTGDTPAPDYNQTIDNSSEKNATHRLVVPSGCTLASTMQLLSAPIAFSNGQSSYQFKYDNVGDINITLTDNDWTKVDQNGSDCVALSSSNVLADGKIGCLVKGSKRFHFIPARFINEFSIKNYGDNNFTYISNSKPMAAQIAYLVRAVNDANVTTTNYTKSCFAEDINYTISLINNKNLTWGTTQGRINFFDDNNVSSQLIYSGPQAQFKSTEGNFTNGVANITVLFNFDRNSSKADEPFKISRLDFNSSVENNASNVFGLDFDRTSDANVPFFYGRVHSPNYTTSTDTVVAAAYYEVYCKNCNHSAYPQLGSESVDDAYWYVNKEHDITDGNITSFDPISSIVITPSRSNSITNGKENFNITYDGSKGYPYKARIWVNTQDWLLFNSIIPNVTKNSFTVEFLRERDWAGIGQSGKTVDTNVSKKTQKRIDW